MGERALGSSPGSAPSCCVILCKSLALSELFPICTSKRSDWVAFLSSDILLLSWGSWWGLKGRNQEATSPLRPSDRQGCQAGGNQKS